MTGEAAHRQPEKILVENEVAISAARFAEAARAAFVYKHRRSLLLWGGLALLGGAYFCVWLGRSSGQWLLAGLQGCVLAAVFLWLIFALPRMESKKAFRAMQKTSGGGETVPRRTVFYQTHCEIDCGGVLLSEIAYNRFTAAKETRHLLVLFFAESPAVILSRDGFSTGSAAELLRLLEQGKEAT